MKCNVFQVSIGNVKSTVGYLEYKKVPAMNTATTNVIVAAVVSAVVVIIAIAALFLLVYKRTVNKILKYQTTEMQMSMGIVEGKRQFFMFQILNIFFSIGTIFNKCSCTLP